MSAEMDLRSDLIFGEFTLDRADERLLGPAGPIRLGNKAFQVLLLLVQQEGRLLTKDSLFSSVWDGTIVSESALTSVIKELRRALGDDPQAPRFIESVYGRGYRFIAPVERVERRERGPLAAAAEDRPERRRRPIAIGLVALAAVAAVAAGLFLWPASPGGAEDPPRVKLVAIRTLSPDLPPGIAESFREELVAAFEAEDAIMLIDTQARRSGSARPLALSATLQKSGDVFRFVTHLTNERNGASIWSQRTELPATFAALAPRQVAFSVSQILRCGLDIGPSLADFSDRQLALWLQYCQESWSEQTTPERVVAAARRVTRAAPDFARGWSALAAAAMPAPNRFTHIDARAQHAEAEHAAAQALRLDPNNSDAYCARGIALVDRRDWVGAETTLRRAIAVRPTECACARLIYGIMLGAVGRFEDSLGQYRRLHDERPLGSQSNAFLAEGLFLAGYSDEAERVLAETLRLWPDRDSILTIRLRRGFWTGRYEDSAATLADSNFRSPPARRAAFAAAFAALRDRRPESRAEAVRLLKAQAEDFRENTRSVTIALAALGENRAAMASAERNLAYTRGVLFDPSFAAARRDPAFIALVERLGMVRYWRRTGRRPDICREANAPAFCRTR